MKLMLTLVGLLTILGGLLPFLSNAKLLPSFLQGVPTSGPIYQGLIVAIGVVAFVYGIRARERSPSS